MILHSLRLVIISSNCGIICHLKSRISIGLRGLHRAASRRNPASHVIERVQLSIGSFSQGPITVICTDRIHGAAIEERRSRNLIWITRSYGISDLWGHDATKQGKVWTMLHLSTDDCAPPVGAGADLHNYSHIPLLYMKRPYSMMKPALIMEKRTL